MPNSLLRTAILGCMLGLAVSAAEPAAPPPEPKVIDLQALPANQWVERSMSGWKGKTYYGQVLCYGFCAAGARGITVLDLQQTPGTAAVRTL